ncbi:Gamma-glutamyltranspeptidase precursor [Bacteroidales bacterium Barb4]|nr:Gamma-glutamyltranspeptidase precursor [Bacteroidales bacterium Barb4]
MQKFRFALYLLALLSGGTVSAREALVKDSGMVVSAHPAASQAGVNILRRGGNAADAAVAVEFALSVVYPVAGNIGGGGFLIYRSAGGETAALDYRETAPAAAFRDMYLNGQGNVIDGKSLYGVTASGIPGTVAGMAEAHRKYGTLSWQELLEPAVRLAEEGFPLTLQQGNSLNEERDWFIRHNPAGCAFVKDSPWQEGDILRQPELAATLRLIQQNGRDGFYKGETARRIVAQMASGGGIITSEDLENYKAVWRKPVEGTYREYGVISMPPPSSGGIALFSLLKATEKYPLSQWGFQQDSTIQLMVEAQRRVYADRAEYLGDPDFVAVPQRQLLDTGYISRRMADISFERATPSIAVRLLSLVPESEETTHYVIIDKDRNAVSATTTLNGTYGSKTVVAEAGFLLNNEMDDFSAKPGTPNLYGLTGGEANAIAPRKRMLSSMTPTILTKNGRLFMAVGSPGGSTIITSVFQTILNVTLFGMDAQTAVSLPRFHHQWLPDTIQAEDGAIPNEVRTRLESKGYPITPRSPYGRVEAIVVRSDNTLEGGADPRGDDKATGY